MKERNTTGMWLFASLLFATMLMSIGLSEAADVTIDPPIAGGTASTSAFEVLVNVTGITAGEINVSNVTLFYSTTVGGTQVFITDNATQENDTTHSFTWDTSALTDLRTYVLYAYAYNDTPDSNTQIGTTSNSNIIVDNTLPTSTYGATTPANGANQQSPSVVINTASDASVDSCVLFFGQNANALNQFNGTVSSNVCSVTRTVDPNSYTYYLVTSDGVNDSTLATQIVRVESNSAGVLAGGLQQQQQAIQQQQQGRSRLMIIGIIIVVVIVLFFVFGKKK